MDGTTINGREGETATFIESHKRPFSRQMICMDEALLNEIEEARRMGAVFILKWDGERSGRVYTVILSHHEKQFMFRADTDDMIATAQEALQQFQQATN